jgi:hypothetical protein
MDVPERHLAPKGQPHVGNGIPYAGIVRARAADNAELDDRNRITLDSIRTHCVAKATYWHILKRRAGENRIDFIEGVATALTPIAFFETVMVRSYETLSTRIPGSM